MFVELLERVRTLRGIPIWVRYLATTILVLACFGLRMALERADEPSHLPLYLLFVPAVLIAAFLFDRGSGYFAVALSGLLGLYFFIEPDGSFRIIHAGEAIRLVAFVLIGVLCASLVEALRKTVDDLAERTRELMRRTQELSSTRAELLRVNEHRQLLLSDLNHRIKNHLASVAAGISLSRSSVGDSQAREALDAAIGRLDVLGRVYTRLHLEGSEVSLDARDFLQGLCADLAASLIGPRPIALTWHIQPKRLTAQYAVNLGLIVNELVTNAVKYAFPDDRPGEIQVRYGDQEGVCRLEILDNGSGPPPTGRMGVGTKLVKGLASQMGGTAEWHHAPGTRVVVTLPECEA